MVLNTESDYVFLLGIVLCIQNIMFNHQKKATHKCTPAVFSGSLVSPARSLEQDIVTPGGGWTSDSRSGRGSRGLCAVPHSSFSC